ncbi:MAG TPA: hypothetical protein VEG40_03850 [Gaiellaceae bacterium]|nr:hypothetical protein [Gaiellaceae bacterium]
MIAALGGSLLLVAASAPSAPTAAKLKVVQQHFPPPLVAPGERIEVGYNTLKLPAATGVLYVRNDLQHTFTRVTLRWGKSPKPLTWQDELRLLRGFAPASLVRGHWLYYYAVIHDRKSGRSVRVPAGLESVRVLTGAQVIKLGTHRFGNLRAPEAIVASAGPTDVGIGIEGKVNGPWSFQIAPDRSVWLVDTYNWRLLVWPPGQPNAHPRAVSLASLPGLLGDFALGPGGSLYVSHKRPGKHHTGLSRLSATGHVLWTSELATTIHNINLRLGPDGTLYWTGGLVEPRGGDSWVPVATPSGRPLSTAYQLRRRLHYQPLPGGLRLVSTPAAFEKGFCAQLVPYESRFALIDRAGRVLRAWRITSRTTISESLSATPALVGGDPVVVLRVARPSGPAGNRCASVEAEYLVLRLARSGPSRIRFSLPAASEEGKDQSGRAGWGFMITDVRSGPGAKLYQLGSSPTVGVRIMRFSLAAAK